MIKVHFVGIGGTGISAIARVLLEKGWQVSGTDMQASTYFNAVTLQGAETRLGHHPDLAVQADLLVRSSAVKDNDPEVMAAREVGIPVLKRADFLPELTKYSDTLAVAGSHGKTTTTAMLIHLFRSAGKDPSFILGSDSKSLRTNAHAGKDKSFIIEADEYDYMFLGLEPFISLVLNIEYDHPDFFPTESDYLQAFVDFIHKTRPEGKILLGGDDEGVQHLIDQVGDLSEKISCFGFNPTSDYRVIDHEILEHGQHFSLLLPNEEKIGPFRLPLPGKFNVLNAAAALAAAHLFGLDIKTLTDALIDFHGTSRRFDLVCQQGDVLVFNDYGHHPSQLRQTIQGARELYPYHSIWAVWEPHTISRTKRLHSEFASALCSADQSVILRLFGAREDDSSYSPEAIANEILDANCVYLPDNDLAASHILSGLTGKDVVLVFSAGKGPEFSQLLCEKIIREAQND